MWAIVPYKGVPSGKSRLAEHLGEEQRRELSQAMLHDVLEALASAASLSGVIVSSPSVDALKDVRTAGVRKFRDHGSTLAEAVTEAAKYAMSAYSAKSTFIVPADIPLIQSGDVDFAADGHTQVTIIPDDREIGTNGLICTPPDAIEYVFDGKSFEPHKQAALAKNLTPKSLYIESMGHDIDTIYDLKRVLELGPTSRTADVIRTEGLVTMLEASTT